MWHWHNLRNNFKSRFYMLEFYGPYCNGWWIVSEISTFRMQFDYGHIWTVAIKELSFIHHMSDCIWSYRTWAWKCGVHRCCTFLRLGVAIGETFIRWMTDFPNDATRVQVDVSFKRIGALQIKSKMLWNFNVQKFILKFDWGKEQFIRMFGTWPFLGIYHGQCFFATKRS